MHLAFLNPAVLWLLPLSLTPVILHLFFRRKPKNVLFSDLRFIKLSSRRVTPKKNLYQILLLITRCLILLLLCLYFAKPSGYFGGFSHREANKQIAVLIDGSYSMRFMESGRRRFDIAKDIVLEIARRNLRGGHRGQKVIDRKVSVIQFSDKIDKYTGPSADFSQIESFVKELQPGFFATDVVPAMELAHRLVSDDPDSERFIFIVSDMAKNMFMPGAERMSFLPGDVGGDVRIVFINIGPAAGNLCIEGADVNGRAFGAVAEISNYSDDATNTGLSLFVENKSVYYDRVVVQANSRQKREINTSIPGTGDGIRQLPCVLKIDIDRLAEDDAYWFVHTAEPPVRVLVIDGDPKLIYGINSESYYLQTSLKEDEKSRFYVEVNRTEDLQRTGGSGRYDTIILCNLDALPAATFETLSRMCDTIIIFPGDRVRVDEYPAFIAGNIGTLQEKDSVIGDFGPAKESFPEMDRFELGKIVFRKYFRLNEINASTLVRHDDGSPLLLLKYSGGTKVYIFGSTADMDWCNMPSKPFFPYFISQLCLLSRATERAATGLKVGSRIEYFPVAGFYSGAVTSPSGARLKTEVVGTGNVRKVVTQPVEEPGIYEMKLNTDAGAITRYFAVNLDRASKESDLAKYPPDEIMKIFGRTPVSVLNYGKNTMDEVMNVLEGKSLMMEFLLCVLLFSIIEVILANA